jgi:hypothetical protein
LRKRSPECHRERLNAGILAFCVLVATVAYLGLEIIEFRRGNRGELRGALIASSSAVLALCALAPKRRVAIAIAFCLVAGSFLGVAVLLVHSPAAPALGLTLANPDDFDINYAGALELYGRGGSPYGIEHKYNLHNISVSFPFPTYAIYWLCAGLGLWGKARAGLALTIVNVAAALALIWGSFHLGGGGYRTLPGAKRLWFLAAALFLAGASPFWLAVLEGQTPVLAACLVILGLWSARNHFGFSGGLLALGVLIKPNFSPLLLYFPIAYLRTLALPQRGADGKGYLRTFLLTGVAAGCFVAISLVLPHGMRTGTYIDFLTKVSPLLMHEAGDSRNMSLIGLANRLLPVPLPPGPTAGLLLAAAIAFGMWRRQTSWLVWVVVPLLVSPITWAFYAGLMLPAQFAVACNSLKREHFVDLVLLLTSVGLLWAPRHLDALGAVALLVTFFLTLRLDPGDLIPSTN